MLTTLILMTAIDIPHLKGDPLKPWGEAGLPLVALAGRGPTLRPYAEFGATARLGWTDEGLAAQITVTDPTDDAPSDPARPYEADSVELYLGMPGEPNMVQLVVSRKGKRLFDYRKAGLRKSAQHLGRSSFSRTRDGYVVRALLAWKTLGLTPSEGLEVGARVAANEGSASREREGLLWPAGDFYSLAPVRLSAFAGAPPATVSWAAPRADLRGAVVNVVADAPLAGRKVRLAGHEASLTTDGPRSVARFEVPVGVGEAPGKVSVEVDDEGTQTVVLPDLSSLRRQAFVRGTGPFRGAFHSTTIEGDALPHFEMSDSVIAERLVGPITVETSVYDGEGRKIDRPSELGRYGAVVHLSAPAGGETTRYVTLLKGVGEPNEKSDRDWWHALRKRLGTAVQYESYLRFPDERAGKRWPLIVYLHGSGGGDEGAWENTRRYDGPMGYAAAHPGFPFATLALRSPGGWYPPAVKDAIDDAVATGRIDPDRIVLCGFSMGAMGTWSVAYDEPSRFAALAIVGGRRGDPAKMPLIKNVPVWVFNGEIDEATLASDARAAVASLKAAGGHVRYTHIPGATHVDSLRIAFAKPELYAWMEKQKRKPSSGRTPLSPPGVEG